MEEIFVLSASDPEPPRSIVINTNLKFVYTGLPVNFDVIQDTGELFTTFSLGNNEQEPDSITVPFDTTGEFEILGSPVTGVGNQSYGTITVSCPPP